MKKVYIQRQEMLTFLKLVSDFSEGVWASVQCSVGMHISRRGGHILFFIFPHFWLVSKACNVSRGILLKKMKKNHFEYENLQIKTLN